MNKTRANDKNAHKTKRNNDHTRYVPISNVESCSYYDRTAVSLHVVLVDKKQSARSCGCLDFVRAQARTCILEGDEQRGPGNVDDKHEREGAGLTSWS